MSDWTLHVPQGVQDICAVLRESSFSAFVVGGAMRDVLRKREPADWDIATSARPDDVIKLFPKVVLTGVQHGTVTVVLPDGQYEVTTFRGEGAYSDGRRPDSVFFLDNAIDDLARRDFTINAIAGDPLTGEILDPFDGQADIKRGLIKAVGDPDARFSEDGLRTLRAARFASMLEFDLDLTTEAAIPRHLKTFAKVSVERQFEEVGKLLVKSRLPSWGLSIMLQTGLLSVVLPELSSTFAVGQNKYHEFDVFGHTMYMLDLLPPRLTLRLAGMLHDVGKPAVKAWNDKTQDWTFYEHEDASAKIADKWLKRMKASNELREEVVALVQHHLILYVSDWTDAAVRRWVKRVGPCRVHDLLELAHADAKAQGNTPFTAAGQAAIDELQERVTGVMNEQPALDVCNLAVSGEDIMQILGVKPGKIVGQVKKELLELVLEQPELNTREMLEPLVLEVAKKLA